MPDIQAATKKKCAKLQAELGGLLRTPGDYPTAVDGLTLYRREKTNRAEEEGWAIPHATIVFQGVETVTISGRDYICRPCQCRVTGQDVVGNGYIAEASSELPFLAVSLSLSNELIEELARKIKRAASGGNLSLKRVSVEETDLSLLDAFLRLIKLLKTPACIPVFAPIIICEIHYLLLIGPHGRP